MAKRGSVKKTPVTLLALSIATALCAPAYAQQATGTTQPATDDAQDTKGATPQELDTVRVVGTFRQSVAKALDDKRYSVDQIDSIVAEDIGKFPDLNLAESLQRIPGVSIDRDAGEGRSITVRGLGPDFTRVRINGMEALATTGGTDSSGGANRGRGFDFNVFASELFNSLTVRKTQAAEIDEGSLGATVDLRAARPFDYKGFTSSISGQIGYNDLSESWDPRGVALISNTWADGRFGALLSVAYSERGLIEEGFSAVRWEPSSASGGYCSPVGVTPASVAPGSNAANCATGVPRGSGAAFNDAYATASAGNVFGPRLPRYGRLTHEQQRLGVTGSMQFKIADDMVVSVDGLYAKLDATRQEDFLETISFSRTAAQGGKPQTVVREAQVDDRGNLVYGVFDNVDVRSESRYDELSTTFRQLGIEVDQKLTDRLHLNARVGHSDSKFDNPVQTTVTLDVQNADGYAWDFRGNDKTPRITYPFNVSDPASWQWVSNPAANSTGSEIRIRPITADNTFDTGKFDLAFKIDERFTLKGGLGWKEYGFETTEFRRANETRVPNLPAGTTVAGISAALTDFGRGLGQPSGNASGWVIPNLGAIAGLFNIYCNCDPTPGVAGDADDFRLTSTTNGNARGNNFSVTEANQGGYLQLDFNVDMFDRPLRGNFGARYAATDVTTTGYLATGGGSPVTVHNEYSDVLPSLNLAWNAADDIVLRFGAAKVMARPQLPNLSPGGTINTTLRTITTGNPLLEPFRATTYDFSAEWYFAQDALLGVALFYKDIDSYIQTLRETRPYNTTGLPLDLLTPVGLPADTPFDITSPVNTPGGPLKGFEINYQQPFSFLSGAWSGFGVILNYTHVESQIDYAVSPTSTQLVTADLVNLSPDSYNATLYYENDHFSARVSGSYRDEYLQVVPGRNNNDVEGKHETFNLDMSVTWNVNDRLALTLEGINLTDEFNDQFVDSVGDRTSVYHHTGRQIYAGFRYQF
ncbi:TonB-dependent receptor [Lysobacter sp. HA18]